MDAALSVWASQEFSTHVPNADFAHGIWEPLDLLTEESVGSITLSPIPLDFPVALQISQLSSGRIRPTRRYDIASKSSPEANWKE